MMKSFIATVLLASAAVVSAQISALPPCGITCGLAAAKDTSCTPVTNFNCTCQLSNQAIILPILEACLAKSCDNAAQSSAAISAGKGICATVVQTGTSSGSQTTTTAMESSTSSSVASTTAASSASMSAASSSNAPAAYTGAAMPTGIAAGVEALVAAAGIVVLAL